MWFFKRKPKLEDNPEYAISEENIVGVTMSWSGRPTLSFKGGWILPKKAELLLFAKYYANGEEWPRNPITGEKLPIAKN